MQPNLTNPVYAAPMFAKAAMSLIPDTLGEVAFMGVAGVATKPLLFAGTAAAKTLLFTGKKAFNYGAKTLGYTGTTSGVKLAYGAVEDGVAGVKGSGAKINSLLTPAYERQQNLKIGSAALNSKAESTGVYTYVLRSSELSPTHNIIMGRNKMDRFVKKIESQGIIETIKFVEHEGVNYVVDGHHRLYAARKLNIEHVPVEQVTLPYKGYKSIADLKFTIN